MGVFGGLFKSVFKPKRHAKRRFEAAQYNRLTHSFMQSARSINAELRGDLDALRRRSRELAKNEPLARKYLSMVTQNVCGASGFKLQSRVTEGGKVDQFANDAIEAAWKAWSKPGVCDVSGKLSFEDMTRAVIKAVARDGEAILRIRDGADNGFGYALQLLDIERLDTTLNRDESTGKPAIVMGVEIDSDGRPIAYHLISNFIGRDVTAKKTVRVDASAIIHLFMTDDPEQMRGIPWMHASMIRMHHLKGYEEAAIVAARVGASKMGFFTTPDGDGTPLADGEEESGIPYTEAEPGQFGVLPEGTTFEKFDPDYPHAMYPEFVKAAKRDIGSGLNAAYHSLANDLEGVNFSSIRSGTLEERDEWMLIQGWLIGQYLDRVFDGWLIAALLSGAIRQANGSALPASKYQKFRAHEFMGRRWQWVDPLKDINASVMAMENGLASPYTIAGQQGVDAEDVLSDIARFQALADSLGVKLGKQIPVDPNKPDPNKETDTKE